MTTYVFGSKVLIVSKDLTYSNLELMLSLALFKKGIEQNLKFQYLLRVSHRNNSDTLIQTDSNSLHGKVDG